MQPSYARPRYAPPPPAVSVTKARPWLIGLSAGVTMLVLIAAVGNPPVTRALVPASDSFLAHVRDALASFEWNFARMNDTDDPMHFYFAHLVGDLVAVLLIMLLVALLTSGRGAFWRTFAAAWTATIVAIMLAGYVQAALIDPQGTVPGNDFGNTTFFSQFSPGPFRFLAAIAFGFVVALIAALVGIMTRKHEVLTAPPVAQAPMPASEDEPAPTFANAPERREPWSAPPVGGGAVAPGPMANPSPWSKSDDERPSANPTNAESDSERTTQLPAVGEGTDSPDDEQHTRALPRIEDDPPKR